MNAVDKRLFYLMLSTTEGQDYAKAMGFSMPSKEVIDAEHSDILTRWAVILHYGLLHEVQEAAKWLTDFMEETGKLFSESEEFQSVLTVYGVALVNKLMESEKLALVLPIGDDDE